MTAPWMPPLPTRACIVTYMGDGKGLHYSLSVAAGAPLVEQSPGAQLDLFTADQMRRAQADAARAALEQAEKVCREKARRNFPWGSENSDIYHAQADWAERCADAIRALAKEIT